MHIGNRMRRTRSSAILRDLVRETHLSTKQFVMPYFIKTGSGIQDPIKSMPGQFQFSLDTIIDELSDLQESGIQNIILFGLPEKKDAQGSDAFHPQGIIQEAVRKIKSTYPELLVITDLCLCEYTDHGHCGVVTDQKTIDNDATLALLMRAAVAQCESGADIIAPSGMMDGAVGAIRDAMDESGYSNIPIMGYSAKFSSSFYGPFRHAAESKPSFGDRRAYQMDPANAHEALREVSLDIEEGVDIVMVKPALPYLDIISQVSSAFSYPTAAYCVSGEYAMIKAAAEKGWLNEQDTVMEMMTSIKRAGANIILTYWAKDIAQWMKG